MTALSQTVTKLGRIVEAEVTMPTSSVTAGMVSVGAVVVDMTAPAVAGEVARDQI